MIRKATLNDLIEILDIYAYARSFMAKNGKIKSDILFADYVIIWLKAVAPTVDEVTYQGYEMLANSHIIPYFKDKKYVCKIPTLIICKRMSMKNQKMVISLFGTTADHTQPNMLVNILNVF